MTKKSILPAIVIFIAALFSGSPLSADSLLIDDFSRNDGIAATGTAWQGFTDRVMGGRSDMRAGFVQVAGNRVLRMEGDVSLENNGGFVQVRLPLNSNELSAESYSGVRIRYRPNLDGDYYIHLRTRGNRLPWAYFAGSLAENHIASDRPGELISEIPWEAFSSEPRASRELRPDLVNSIALVATKTPGPVSIDLISLELYR